MAYWIGTETPVMDSFLRRIRPAECSAVKTACPQKLKCEGCTNLKVGTGVGASDGNAGNAKGLFGNPCLIQSFGTDGTAEANADDGADDDDDDDDAGLMIALGDFSRTLFNVE